MWKNFIVRITLSKILIFHTPYERKTDTVLLLRFFLELQVIVLAHGPS